MIKSLNNKVSKKIKSLIWRSIKMIVIRNLRSVKPPTLCYYYTFKVNSLIKIKLFEFMSVTKKKSIKKISPSKRLV